MSNSIMPLPDDDRTALLLNRSYASIPVRPDPDPHESQIGIDVRI